MTRSIRGSRRAAVVLGGMAAATGLLASGCGTGQIAETAIKEPSIQGVNTQTPDNGYKIRGLVVEYPGPDGYRAGADAPVSAVIYNDTRSPAIVTVTTDSAHDIVLAGTAGSTASATPDGSTIPDPSAGLSAPPGGPARIEIPALGYAQLNLQGGRYLQLIGLNESLRAGQQVNLVFDFGSGGTISTPVPVSVPLSPVAPPSPVIEVEGGEEGGHGD